MLSAWICRVATDFYSVALVFVFGPQLTPMLVLHVSQCVGRDWMGCLYDFGALMGTSVQWYTFLNSIIACLGVLSVSFVPYVSSV